TAVATEADVEPCAVWIDGDATERVQRGHADALDEPEGRVGAVDVDLPVREHVLVAMEAGAPRRARLPDDDGDVLVGLDGPGEGGRVRHGAASASREHESRRDRDQPAHPGTMPVPGVRFAASARRVPARRCSISWSSWWSRSS